MSTSLDTSAWLTPPDGTVQADAFANACPPVSVPSESSPAHGDGGLEGCLSHLGTGLDGALGRATELIQELRKARSAVGSGDVGVLKKALPRAGAGADDLAASLRRLSADGSFDASLYLRDGRYAAEVVSTAHLAGLPVEEVGDRLVCHPSVLRIRSDPAVVEIDGCRAARASETRFRAAPFLDAIETAYLRLTNSSPGTARVVRVVDVWELLTLLPGSRNDYPKAEFGRDLNLLDESGLTVTRTGRTVRFSASSGTRTDGALTTVGRDGRPHIYWGVSFS